MMLFDPKLLELHRDFAADNLHKSDFLFKFAADDIIEHLKLLNSDFTNIIELGARTGFISDFILKFNKNLVVTDPSSKMLKKNPAINKVKLAHDDDLNFPYDSADLMISSMNIHWINNVPNFIKQVHNILKSNGVFIGNFIGAGSFNNLKKIFIQTETESSNTHFMHVIPLIPAENAYKLFQEAGFNFIVVNTHKIELEYDSPIRLMKELKNMGENNPMIEHISPLPKKILNYKDNFEDSVTMITVVGKKKSIT